MSTTLIFESMEKSKKKSKRLPAHGTYTRYKYHHCPCKRCKAAVAKYVADYRAKNKKSKDLSNLTHGLRSSYNNGCRCDLCAEANREYSRNWKRESKAA